MGTVATILISFNRPRLIQEALQSCKHADQLIIADDGSDVFNPAEALAELHHSNAMLLSTSRRSVEDRIAKEILGLLVNRALRLVETDYVTYLCDDDLFHPDWIAFVRKTLDTNPEVKSVYGKWIRLGTEETGGYMPAGSLAHRSSLKVLWNPYQTCGVDETCAFDIRRAGGLLEVQQIAGWRRDHPMNLANFRLQPNLKDKATEEFLRKGALE